MNLAGVEFQVYLEEHMKPTRFWYISRQNFPQAYRFSDMPIKQIIQSSHISSRSKTRTMGQSTPHIASSLRVLSKNRGPRLRWAYEHEQIVNASLKYFLHYAFMADEEMSRTGETFSPIHEGDTSMTVSSKQAKRKKSGKVALRQWAHQQG